MIKREIKERDWFVYCESESSKKSHYVAMERKYVESLNDPKLIWRIDLNQPLNRIKEKVFDICCHLNCFITCGMEDKSFAMNLADYLKNMNFRTTMNLQNFTENSKWNFSINSEINDFIRSGFVLAILDKDTYNNKTIENELNIAKNNKATIIILTIGNGFNETELANKYNTIHIYNLPCVPKDEDMEIVYNLIKAVLTRKISGIIDYKAKVYNVLSQIQQKLNYERHYHPEKPVYVRSLGAKDVYTFPCCGKRVCVGDREYLSVDRADGCKIKKD